jgi:selT/selW/selH-like putative selenoprotein
VADEVMNTFGVEALISKGSTGCFDVFVNGKLIFSKFEEGRFPKIDEISGIIKTEILDNEEG